LDVQEFLAAIARAIEQSRLALEADLELRLLQARYGALTRREREIMQRVVLGRLNRQVALELAIREITVRTHRGSMMRKMMARSVPELVNMAARLGISSPIASRDSSEGTGRASVHMPGA